MRHKTITRTETQKSDSTSNNSVVQSYIVGSNVDVNFTVKSVEELCFQYTKATFEDFKFDLAARYTLADVSSVKVFVHNDNPDNFTLNDMRFTVSVAGTDMCDISCFELSNVASLTGNNIAFNGISSTDTDVADDIVVVYVVVTKNK